MSMKKTLLMAEFLIGSILLINCTGKTSQSLPAPTLLTDDPQITEYALATPSPTPSQLPDESMPTPTSQPPTPTLTEILPTPTASPTPQVNPTSAGQDTACEDKAAFYSDITIPDNSALKQNQEFLKTWQIKNEGTCTWDGYQLVFAGGDSMNGPLNNPIGIVKPGELAEISVKLRSPNQGGLYTGFWEFQNLDGKRFGVNAGGIDFIWVIISVTYYPEGSTLPGVSTLAAPANCSPSQDANIAKQLLDMINQTRASQGLPQLNLDSRLSKAAQVHSEDMACKNYIDHNGSDGSTWFDRLTAQDYPFTYASENIGAADPAFGDATWMFNWWMNSQIHRDNILSSKVTEIGIGYAYNNDSQYKGYYTLDFAKPIK